MNNSLLTSKTDNWSTPKNLYEWFMEHGFYDPCPLNSDDGLNRPWPNLTFINLPFSKIDEFVDYGLRQSRNGTDNIQIWLVPARTDTKWFFKLATFASRIVFIGGRLKFGDSKHNAPFPSCLVYIDWFHTTQSIDFIPREHLVFELNRYEMMWLG